MRRKSVRANNKFTRFGLRHNTTSQSGNYRGGVRK